MLITIIDLVIIFFVFKFLAQFGAQQEIKRQIQQQLQQEINRRAALENKQIINSLANHIKPPTSNQ